MTNKVNYEDTKVVVQVNKGPNRDTRFQVFLDGFASMLGKCLAVVLIFFLVMWLSTKISNAEQSVSIQQSTITLRETTQPGAVAEVVFMNTISNIPEDNGQYLLSDNGMTVEGTFGYNVLGNYDSVSVEPMEGYVAVPPTVIVPEGQAGFIYIYPIEGLGM